MTDCIACHRPYDPPRIGVKRCEECIRLDRRASRIRQDPALNAIRRLHAQVQAPHHPVRA